MGQALRLTIGKAEKWLVVMLESFRSEDLLGRVVIHRVGLVVRS